MSCLDNCCLGTSSPRGSFALFSAVQYGDSGTMQGASPGPRLSIDTATRLLGMSDPTVEVLRGRQFDTKAVIAASGATIMVAFRGTDSLPAVCADLQARSADHSPKAAFQPHVR